MARKIRSPVGRPPTLTPEKADLIIDAVPKVLVRSLIAGMAGVHPDTLYDWLNWGAIDLKAGKDSIYAQLSVRYDAARTQYIQRILGRLETSPPNHGALTWILEKGFRAQFGADSEEIRELRAMFEQFKPLLDKKE